MKRVVIWELGFSTGVWALFELSLAGVFIVKFTYNWLASNNNLSDLVIICMVVVTFFIIAFTFTATNNKRTVLDEEGISEYTSMGKLIKKDYWTTKHKIYYYYNNSNTYRGSKEYNEFNHVPKYRSKNYDMGFIECLIIEFNNSNVYIILWNNRILNKISPVIDIDEIKDLPKNKKEKKKFELLKSDAVMLIIIAAFSLLVVLWKIAF